MIHFDRSMVTALLAIGIAAQAQSTAQVPQSNTSTIDAQGTAHVTRVVPLPATVSEDGRKFMAQPRSDADPRTSLAENRANAEKWQETLARDMQSMYPAALSRDTIAGVPVRIITPPSIPDDKKDRVLLNVHGGGFQADWGSVAETVPIASLTHTRVVAVLYRLAPEHPFPAQVEDTIAVYRELLKTYKPRNIALYGTSAGAILTGEVAVRLNQMGLPLPGALGIFSGSGDFARPGDSLAIFGLWGLSGFLENPGARGPDAYVGQTDPRDPVLSPIFADLKAMPPALFLTSERDLLLSGTSNLHRAFRKAGADAELIVFDGLHHAFWNEFRLPESVEADRIIADFFDRHLGK